MVIYTYNYPVVFDQAQTERSATWLLVSYLLVMVFIFARKSSK